MEAFRVGDLVWAKMKGFPSWPGRIAEPQTSSSPRRGHSYVVFYGTNDHAYIRDQFIVHHSQDMVERVRQKKVVPATLRKGADEIEAEAAGRPPRDPPPQAPPPKTFRQKLALKYKRLDKMKPHRRRVLSELQPSKKPSHRQAPPPSGRRVGFVGLSHLGVQMALRLLDAGHSVTVWGAGQEGEERAELLVRHGALRGATAADVVAACEITFGCAADAGAAKTQVFNPVGGVLRGLEAARKDGAERGYVELSRLDVETSLDIALEVKSSGGRYLEAPTAFMSLAAAKDDGAPMLVAGDGMLFKEHEACFNALSGNVFYVGHTPGPGTRVALAASSLAGTLTAAAGEALALAERLNISKKELLEVAYNVGFESAMLREKFATNAPPDAWAQSAVTVAAQQADLQATMSASNELCRPMEVCCAANELYKNAVGLGYAHKDSQAIHLAAKF